jgi:hypothetical protein
VIVDLSGSQDIRVTVPWGQFYVWAENSDIPVSGVLASWPVTGTTTTWPVNGYLQIFVVEPLVANTTLVPTLTISVFTRAGEDFRVCDPTTELAQYFYAVGDSSAVDGSAFAGKVARLTVHKFTGVVIPDQVLLDTGGGEMETTYRLLMHRKDLSYAMYPNSGSSSNPGQMFMTNIMDPMIWPSTGSVTGLNGAMAYVTMQSILLAAYAYYRGCVRHTVIPYYSSVGSWSSGFMTLSRAIRATTSSFLGYRASQYYQGATLPNSLFNLDLLSTGADMSSVSGQQPRPLSVEVPFAYSGMAIETSTRSNPNNSALFSMTGFPGDTNLLGIRVYSSFGDDIQLFGWLGLPELTYIASRGPSTGLSAW